MFRGTAAVVAPTGPPILPERHPVNASWYTSATYELLTTNGVFVRVAQWRDRGPGADERRNMVELAVDDIAGLGKVLRRTNRSLHPDFVLSSLDGHGRCLEMEIPGDGIVCFHLVPEQVMRDKSRKPSTRPSKDSLLACPKVAVHKSIDIDDAMRTPYAERLVRYLWAFGANPVVVDAGRSSLTVATGRTGDVNALVSQALQALTGDTHRSPRSIRYGTLDVTFVDVHKLDMIEFRFVNPLPTRITI
jgi:hypothetical protein